MEDILSALVVFSNFVLIPIAYNSLLVQRRNRFADTGAALLANPESRRNFLGG